MTDAERIENFKIAYAELARRLELVLADNVRLKQERDKAYATLKLYDILL